MTHVSWVIGWEINARPSSEAVLPQRANTACLRLISARLKPTHGLYNFDNHIALRDDAQLYVVGHLTSATLICCGSCQHSPATRGRRASKRSYQKYSCKSFVHAASSLVFEPRVNLDCCIQGPDFKSTPGGSQPLARPAHERGSARKCTRAARAYSTGTWHCHKCGSSRTPSRTNRHRLRCSSLSPSGPSATKFPLVSCQGLRHCAIDRIPMLSNNNAILINSYLFTSILKMPWRAATAS